jgi:hypothetical protein
MTKNSRPVANMRSNVPVAMLLSANATMALSAEPACEAGTYGAPDQNIVALTPKD